MIIRTKKAAVFTIFAAVISILFTGLKICHRKEYAVPYFMAKAQTRGNR